MKWLSKWWAGESRKFKYVLVGTPLTLGAAWAGKQLGLSESMVSTIVQGIIGIIGAGIVGQTVSDVKNGSVSTKMALDQFKETSTCDKSNPQ